MKRVIAAAVYTLAAFYALRVVAFALTEANFLIGIEHLMWALAMWWFAAGLGTRLGLEPHEYVSGIGKTLGLTRPSEDVDSRTL